MRLSFNMKFDQSLNGILNTQAKLTRAENQLSRQTRILSPADDPAAAAKVLGLDQNLNQVEQYQSNSILLKNNLALEETVLANMRTSMDRARTLAIAAGNGTYTPADRAAIAGELKNIQIELFDLMNTRNSEGGYIFSGFQDRNKAYVFDEAEQKYVFQGDDGQKLLQISPTIALSSNDSGKSVFESVDSRYKTTPAVISSGGATAASVKVNNQTQFDAFYRNNYDALSSANNSFNVVLTAPSNYEVLQNGMALTPAVTGVFTPGQVIPFRGLDIVIEGVTAVPSQIDFSLSAPEKINVLNTLNDFIAVLESGVDGDMLTESIFDTITQVTNAAFKVDSTVSFIGGRVNVLDSVFETNADFTINNKSYRAALSEVDYASALTEITKQQIALEAVSAAFVKVSGVSLFDFIR